MGLHTPPPVSDFEISVFHSNKEGFFSQSLKVDDLNLYLKTHVVDPTFILNKVLGFNLVTAFYTSAFVIGEEFVFLLELIFLCL